LHCILLSTDLDALQTHITARLIICTKLPYQADISTP
jgi:hypothetical protein